MQKYEENIAANTSGSLRPLSGASVTVTDLTTGLSASLYSDNGVTPLLQPLTTGNDGYFGFYAADGKYRLTFTSPRIAQFTREILLEDPDDDPYATLAQLSAPTGAGLIRRGEVFLDQAIDAIEQDIVDIQADIDAIAVGPAYELPKATATVLGGIKIGANLAADVDGVITAGVSNGAVFSTISSAATVARNYALPDKSGTVAMLDDVLAATGGRVLLQETIVTSAAPVSAVGWTVRGRPYTSYELEIEGLTCTSSSAPVMEFYNWNGTSDVSVGSSAHFGLSADGAVATGGANISLLPINLGLTSTLTLIARLPGMTGNAQIKLVGINSFMHVPPGNSGSYTRTAAVLSTSPVSYFRVRFNAGNVAAGTFKLYGVP